MKSADTLTLFIGAIYFFGGYCQLRGHVHLDGFARIDGFMMKASFLKNVNEQARKDFFTIFYNMNETIAEKKQEILAWARNNSVEMMQAVQEFKNQSGQAFAVLSCIGTQFMHGDRPNRNGFERNGKAKSKGFFGSMFEGQDEREGNDVAPARFNGQNYHANHGASVRFASSECADISFSSTSAKLDSLMKIQRIAVSGHISAYTLEVSISDGQFTNVSQENGNPLVQLEFSHCQVIYSTLSHVPSWSHVDLLASHVRIRNALAVPEEDVREPLLMLTVCNYDTPIIAFDDSSYTVDTQRAGLVSMYENELTVVFRSFRSGIFFFSVADQGDILIAQVVHGIVHVIFDFVDGVILNKTTPTGLYRKLDLHNQVHIGGRPPDDFSEGIEASFSGCFARLQLNAVDLLHFVPKDYSFHKCQMTHPPSLTLNGIAQAIIPFSFLPFSFEFRILGVPSVLLDMLDAENHTLLQITLEDGHTLHLVSNITRFKQISHPQIDVGDGSWHSFSLRIRGSRLEIEIDGYTILWLEGQEVRRVSVRLATLVLSATGCYRSTTLDFEKVHTKGSVTRGSCTMWYLRLSLIKWSNILAEYPHSCEEWIYRKTRSKVIKGKNITIDLDGGGPMAPFEVVCKSEKDEMGVDVVVTILEHDLKRPILVTGDNKPGVVKKNLIYGIGMEQMDKLVEGFDSCTQYMRYSCRGGARLMTQGEDRSPSSWYATRSDKHGLQWGDAPPYSRMCSCATNGTCIQNRMCNCDSGEDSTDDGVNPYSQLLPVTGLFLGGTTKASSIEVEIGPLICRTRGSRTERGSSGFAGVIRNVYLCGIELQLSTIVRRYPERGVQVGEIGYCRDGLCKNGGACIDKYDGYTCDCTQTPFGGSDCTKEYGMFVPVHSSLQIPWQNPAHTNLCHRIAIQTLKRNVALVRSKALFADSTFNMSINDKITINVLGYLSLSVYDGIFFFHNKTDTKRNLSDDVMHDISFCASSKEFNLSVDGDAIIRFGGNWSFFQNFNVWTFLDYTIVGLALTVILLLFLSGLVCYMRSRPEGVYKTNEGSDHCSPSRSEEPLVNGHAISSKEYFC
uniref:EGF-like domain-containing protein n=1 Tax=Heterorhabditis bacteriophora TaxID=37862 RepID=A0A1I7XA63_HETBA